MFGKNHVCAAPCSAIVAAAMCAQMGIATEAGAQPVLGAISTGVGSTITVPAMDPNDTGATLAGAMVTAFFPFGPETVPWVSLGLGAGHAVGTGWSLSLTGDTGIADWVLTNTFTTEFFTSLSIDLAPGRSAFDFDTPSPGAAGTLAGHTITLSAAGGGAMFIDAKYDNPVELQGSGGPVGDLFSTLTLSWIGGTGVFDANDFVRFVSDTDRVVPAPGALLTLGAGVVALPLGRRRRGSSQ